MGEVKKSKKKEVKSIRVASLSKSQVFVVWLMRTVI